MNKITELKEKHKKEMEKYDGEVRRLVSNGTPLECDYIIHRRIMSNYHRGAYNALVDLEKEQ